MLMRMKLVVDIIVMTRTMMMVVTMTDTLCCTKILLFGEECGTSEITANGTSVK